MTIGPDGKAQFDAGHYPNGANDLFLRLSPEELDAKFGGECGLFHNPEAKEVVKCLPDFIDRLNKGCGHDGLAGKKVVDLGCGTGIMTEHLCKLVGPTGAVVGTEYSPGFLDLCKKRWDGKIPATFIANEVDSIKGVDTATVDLVLMCDVYHHFESPVDMMRDVRRTLRNEDSSVVLVDFIRDPAVHWSHPDNPGWVLEHVRAGKEEFVDEIKQAGLVFSHEVAVEGMKETYMVVFKRG